MGDARYICLSPDTGRVFRDDAQSECNVGGGRRYVAYQAGMGHGTDVDRLSAESETPTVQFPGLLWEPAIRSSESPPPPDRTVQIHTV